jgi:glycosyltransferase involved in cell wall biosynthesis
MRILVPLEHLGPVGGAERSVLEMAEELSRRGHEFVVAYRARDSFESRWEAISSEMIHVPLRASASHPLQTALGWLSAARIAPRTGADIVHCYFLWNLPFSLLAARRTGIPVVMSVREPLVDGARRQAYLRLLRGASAVTFVSAQQKNAYEEAGLRVRRSMVVHTGLDISVYRPPTAPERRSAREGLGIGEDRIILLYLGRLDPAKGIETLFEALSRLSDPRVVLVVAGAATASRSGADEYASRLVATAPSGVKFVGRHDDVSALLWAADVVVVPSVWNEPLTRVGLEAMACGVPVVGSRTGGTPEILGEELEELLFEPADPSALVAALRRALPELGALRRWNEPVRTRVVERFNLKTAADAVESLLVRTLVR